MEITISPENAFDTRVETAQGPMILDEYDTIELMENGQTAGYKIIVQLNGNGFHLNGNIQNKAIELSGLSGLKAAKQVSKGCIEL